MNFLATLLFPLLAAIQVEPHTFLLEIRVLTSAVTSDERRLNELKDDKQYVVFTLPGISIIEGKKKVITLSAGQRLSPYPNRNTSESCEVTVSRNPDGSYKIVCEWLVSHKEGEAIRTEHRPYTRSLTLNTWNFSHYGQSDAQGRERYLGFRLVP